MSNEKTSPEPVSFSSTANPLLDAANRVAQLMALPALLLTAFMGVEGADVSHRDGVLQVTPGTRPGVISRISRANKFAALHQNADSALGDDDLNARFAAAFDDKNLDVQVMTGAQYIKEQLDRFNGCVALAGLAYNAGPQTARNVVNNYNGDPYLAALQYHRKIGPDPSQVTVQPGVDSIDSATGTHWMRFPVVANDTGNEIFQYLYLRQVPGRNSGLLDFIFNPSLLAARDLFQNDTSPGPDTGETVLVVADGQFKLVGGKSTVMFSTLRLSQRDPQWQGTLLGFGDASTTIGTDGCTLTCLTMMANGFGYNETPATLDNKLKALGPNVGFSDALVVWSGIPAAIPGLSLQRLAECGSVPAPMGDIDAALDAGQPVVIEVDFSTQPGFQNHWVLLYARQGGDYLIHDPWPRPGEPAQTLIQRFGFTGSPAQIINYAVFFTGSSVQTRTQPDTTTGGDAGVMLMVQVIDDPDINTAGGLALREAAVDGTVKMRLAAGTLLQVREPMDGAVPKIGQQDKWLRVCNSEGVPGFVAAWFVQVSSATSFGVETEPEVPAVVNPSDIGVVQRPIRHVIVLIVLVNRLKVSPKRTVPTVPLRASPSRGKVLVNLKPGARLTVAEPADTALAKLGKRGKWLNVIDSKGREGYVSAAAVHAAPIKKTKVKTAEPPESFRSGPGSEPAKIAATNALAQALTAPPALAFDIKAVVEVPAETYPLVEVIRDQGIDAVGGLALRDAPINGAVKLRLMSGDQLEIREPASTGLPKVGQLMQWLRVCNSEGVPGYVAAWFVKLVDTTTVPPSGDWTSEHGPVGPAAPGPAIIPEVIAQGVLFASEDAPLLSAARLGSPSSWLVTAGTPLRVTETGMWASKLGQADQLIQVQTYAFKSGYVQASLLKAPTGLDQRAPVEDAHVAKGLGSWLYGLHDDYDRGLFTGSGKAGWVLVTETVGSGAGNTSYADWSNNDFGVIVRLNNDYGGSGTIPTRDQHASFAAQCAQWVQNSRGCSTWVIGNEMNNPREWPGNGSDLGKAITPELYADCFNRVRTAIKQVQPEATVIPGAIDCFMAAQMSCLDWFTRMLADIDDLDGFALHCYTHGYDPELISDLGTFSDDPMRWQYYHFRCFSTFLDVIPAKWRTHPVYITESNAYGESPWAGGRNGWVQAAYDEINRYNQQAFAQQIRALILYRWSKDDVFSIVDKPGVQDDFRATIANTDYRWRH